MESGPDGVLEEIDPELSWSVTFAEEPERIARHGLGMSGLLAPAIPTIHGTDVYVDQLR